MRITQWGEYGVLIAIYIAWKGRNGDSPVVGAAEIANSQEIALQYAQQILLRLRDGSVVESVRGPHGGYRLARMPEEITLKDVLLAAEGHTFEVICESKPINSVRCNSGKSCFLQPVWFGLRKHVDQYLVDYTLDKLVDRLCGDKGVEQFHH